MRHPPDMKTNVLEVLGDRIREKRKARGWTQEDLADNAGIDRSYIGGVERGERNLTFNRPLKNQPPIRSDPLPCVR